MNKVTTFITTYYKHPIAIGIYIIIGIVVIYFILKAVKPKEDPKTNIDWDKNLTPEEKIVVAERAERLFNDMDSVLVLVGLNARDVQAYIDLANMNDKLSTAVYKNYNQIFMKGKGSLTTSISNEKNLPGETKQIILDRFARLNLV